MHDTVDREERKTAIRGQLDEMRRWYGEQIKELRADLIRQYDEMKKLPKDEQKARKKELLAWQLEIKKLYEEQLDLSKALEGELKEIGRREKEGKKEGKNAYFFGFALSLGRPREKQASNATEAELEHLQDSGDTEVRKGFLKLHILGVLAEGPSHGYEIMHRISRHSGDGWTPSPGSMYPALDTLESRGFISCQGDGRRKVYTLTPKGQDALDRIRKMRENQFYEMKAFMSALLGE